MCISDNSFTELHLWRPKFLSFPYVLNHICCLLSSMTRGLNYVVDVFRPLTKTKVSTASCENKEG